MSSTSSTQKRMSQPAVRAWEVRSASRACMASVWRTTLEFMISEVARRALGFDPVKLALLRPALQAFVDSGELAGIVTLTSRSGEIVHAEAIGWSDMETKAPMRSDTLF